MGVALASGIAPKRGAARIASARRASTPALLMVLGISIGEALAGEVHFVDVADEAGVRALHWDGEHPFTLGRLREFYRVPAGAAAGDFDNDGWPDLYVSRFKLPNLLYRNRGDGTFEEVAESAGVNLAAWCSGCTWGDVNNDGWLDLLVLTFRDNGRNLLYINNGDGTFREEGAQRGVELTGTFRLFTSAAFGDFDLDGDLDLLILNWDARNKLMRNDGAGFFQPVNNELEVDLHGVNGFSGGFADMNDDGWPEILVAGDFKTSRLLQNHGPTFCEITQNAQVGTDENGMGSAIADWDGDGRLDWFVTSIFDPNETCSRLPCGTGWTGNRLYRNAANFHFDDATDGLAVRDGGWGWAAAALDFDNDGLLDLAHAAGVYYPHLTIENPFNDDPLRLWRQTSTGAMHEVAQACGMINHGAGRGLLVMDYDRDGDEDVFVANNADYPRLFRNDGGNAAGWLDVALRGTVSNRFGVGARIRVQVSPGGPWQLREVHANSNYMTQNDIVAHFGLGEGVSRVYRLRVEWPASGASLELHDVEARQRLTLHEQICVGDLNGDGSVSLNDLQTLLMHYGDDQARGPEAGNLDGDQRVSLRDLALLLSQFGAACP